MTVLEMNHEVRKAHPNGRGHLATIRDLTRQVRILTGKLGAARLKLRQTEEQLRLAEAAVQVLRRAK